MSDVNDYTEIPAATPVEEPAPVRDRSETPDKVVEAIEDAHQPRLVASYLVELHVRGHRDIKPPTVVQIEAACLAAVAALVPDGTVTVEGKWTSR